MGVAVVGSLPFTTLSPSVVTVVRLPARHMGVTAARMLLDRIGGDDQPPAGALRLCAKAEGRERRKCGGGLEQKTAGKKHGHG